MQWKKQTKSNLWLMRQITRKSKNSLKRWKRSCPSKEKPKKKSMKSKDWSYSRKENRWKRICLWDRNRCYSLRIRSHRSRCKKKWRKLSLSFKRNSKSRKISCKDSRRMLQQRWKECKRDKSRINKEYYRWEKLMPNLLKLCLK